jgi:hypothetical protein
MSPLKFAAISILCLLALSCVEEPGSRREVGKWFVMSEQFTPSGITGLGALTGVVTVDMHACPPRHKGALGQCYSFIFKPEYSEKDLKAAIKLCKIDEGNFGFGAIWQSPTNNWGEKPGKYVKAGAKQIRFRVRATRPGRFAYGSGGLGVPKCTTETYPYKDSYIIHAFGDRHSQLFDFNDKEWTEYTLPLIDDTTQKSIFDGEDEIMVLGAFNWWYPGVEGEKPITIYFDDIVWE